VKHSPAVEVQGILFDFDGTLAHLNIDFQCIREAVKSVGIEMGVPPSFLEKRYILEAIDEAAAKLRIERPVVADVFIDAASAAITDVEVRAAAHSHLLPGVIELFEGLRARRIAVGIVTRNCRQAVEIIMGESLAPDSIRTRDDVDRVKPDPSHLLIAASDLGLSTDRVWMVGDHPTDMVAGNNAGMRCVGVLTGKSSAEELTQGGAWKVIPQVAILVELLPA